MADIERYWDDVARTECHWFRTYEQVFTFQMLQRQVAKLAGGLKKLGVQKGDRVIIYMPLTPEGIMAMLACARIGAVHSVVYAGLGASALRQRIEDAQAKVVLCADVGYRRGKRVELKAIVDEATEGNPLVEHVVVLHRTQPQADPEPGEVDWIDLMATRSGTTCPAWLF